MTDDLIGKKGVTNKGESYGNDFDAFIKDKLTVERTDGVDAAFKYLLDGKADYLTAGSYSGLAEGAKAGVKDQIEALSPTILLQKVALPILGFRVQPGHYGDDDLRTFRHDASGCHVRLGHGAKGGQADSRRGFLFAKLARTGQG